MITFIFTIIGFVFWIAVISTSIYAFVMLIKAAWEAGGDKNSGKIRRGDYPDDIYNALR